MYAYHIAVAIKPFGSVSIYSGDMPKRACISKGGYNNKHHFNRGTAPLLCISIMRKVSNPFTLFRGGLFTVTISMRAIYEIVSIPCPLWISLVLLSCVSVLVCVFVRARVHLRMCVRVRACAFAYVRMCTRVYARVRACTCKCLCACVSLLYLLWRCDGSCRLICAQCERCKSHCMLRKKANEIICEKI